MAVNPVCQFFFFSDTVLGAEGVSTGNSQQGELSAPLLRHSATTSGSSAISRVNTPSLVVDVPLGWLMTLEH